MCIKGTERVTAAHALPREHSSSNQHRTNSQAPRPLRWSPFRGTPHLPFPVGGWCRGTLTQAFVSQGAVTLGAPPAAGQLGGGPRAAASVSVLCPSARGEGRGPVTDRAGPPPAPFPLGHHAECSSADSGSTSTATEAMELCSTGTFPGEKQGRRGTESAESSPGALSGGDQEASAMCYTPPMAPRGSENPGPAWATPKHFWATLHPTFPSLSLPESPPHLLYL